MIHETVAVLVDPEKPFSDDWGPQHFTMAQRHHMIAVVKGRGMLAGCLTTINWPLIRCDYCQAIAPIDSLSTPQDDCVCEPDERMRVFCDFGCAQEYQRTMREFMDSQPDSASYIGEYMLQNTVEMIGMNTQTAP